MYLFFSVLSPVSLAFVFGRFYDHKKGNGHHNPLVVESGGLNLAENVPFYDALAEYEETDDHDPLESRYASVAALANALPNIHSYIQADSKSIEKVVNPLGTVTTVTSCLTTDLKTDILDEVVSQLAAEDTVIHENCDESLFRPVVAIFCDKSSKNCNDNEVLKAQEFCQPPEDISNKLIVPVISQALDDEICKNRKQKCNLKCDKALRKANKDCTNLTGRKETKANSNQQFPAKNRHIAKTNPLNLPAKPPEKHDFQGYKNNAFSKELYQKISEKERSGNNGNTKLDLITPQYTTMGTDQKCITELVSDKDTNDVQSWIEEGCDNTAEIYRSNNKSERIKWNKEVNKMDPNYLSSSKDNKFEVMNLNSMKNNNSGSLLNVIPDVCQLGAASSINECKAKKNKKIIDEESSKGSNRMLSECHATITDEETFKGIEISNKFNSELEINNFDIVSQKKLGENRVQLQLNKAWTNNDKIHPLTNEYDKNNENYEQIEKNKNTTTKNSKKHQLMNDEKKNRRLEGSSKEESGDDKNLAETQEITAGRKITDNRQLSGEWKIEDISKSKTNNDFTNKMSNPLEKQENRKDLNANDSIESIDDCLEEEPIVRQSEAKLLPEFPTPTKNKSQLNNSLITDSYIENLDRLHLQSFEQIEVLPPLEIWDPVMENKSPTILEGDAVNFSLINFESPLQDNPALARKITPLHRNLDEQKVMSAICDPTEHYELKPKPKPKSSRTKILDTESTKNQNLVFCKEKEISVEEIGFQIKEESVEQNTVTATSSNSSGTDELPTMDDHKTMKKSRRRKLLLTETTDNKQFIEHEELKPLITMSESLGNEIVETESTDMDNGSSLQEVCICTNHSTTTDSEGPLPATTSDDNIFVVMTPPVTMHKNKTKKLEHKINLMAAIEAATSSSTSSAEESSIELGNNGSNGVSCIISHSPNNLELLPSNTNILEENTGGVLTTATVINNLSMSAHSSTTVLASSSAALSCSVNASSGSAKKKTKRRKR